MKSISLFNAFILSISLVSGDWSRWYRGGYPLSVTNYTVSSDSSAYITEICVTTDSSSFHHPVSITATYSNGDVSGPFGGVAAADSISSCFTVLQEDECITKAMIYTGYYLNSLQFATSATRASDVWGIRSVNDVYSTCDDEGACVSKIEVSATASSLVAIRFDFEAFEATEHSSTSSQPTELTQNRIDSTTQNPIYSTTMEPNISFPFDINDGDAATLAETGCDGIQYLEENVAVYILAGVCWVSYDDEAENQFSTMLQCTEDGARVMFDTYSSTDCTGYASSSIAYTDILTSMALNASDYRIFCGGNACNYGIRREYPTADCSDKREEVKAKYSDTVFLMNGDETEEYCQNFGGVSMKYNRCTDGVSIDYTMYLAANCMGNGNSLTQSFMNGACDEDNSHQYEIVCGVANVSPLTQGIDTTVASTTGKVEKISMETTDHEHEADTQGSNGWPLILVFVVVVFGCCVFLWFKRKWRNAKNDLMHHVLDSAVEAVVHNDHHKDYQRHHTHPDPVHMHPAHHSHAVHHTAPVHHVHHDIHHIHHDTHHDSHHVQHHGHHEPHCHDHM